MVILLVYLLYLCTNATSLVADFLKDTSWLCLSDNNQVSKSTSRYLDDLLKS